MSFHFNDFLTRQLNALKVFFSRYLMINYFWGNLYIKENFILRTDLDSTPGPFIFAPRSFIYSRSSENSFFLRLPWFELFSLKSTGYWCPKNKSFETFVLFPVSISIISEGKLRGFCTILPKFLYRSSLFDPLAEIEHMSVSKSGLNDIYDLTDWTSKLFL